MHPVLLAAVALVGLPVVIHLLLKQQPKRLLFPAVRFLVLSRKTSQRKLRLRHLLLLALRILIIAAFGLALYQPTLLSRGLNLAAESPVAAVFVLDTSPSMGYTANGKTRMDEAKRRAGEFLDELPAGSRVAVLDPAEPGGTWDLTPADARRRLDAITTPRGAGVPVTAALATAYQLLRTVDQETEAAEPLPRAIVVFSDRAAACWDATRTDDLVKLRDGIPEPKVAHIFLDVGVDQPADVGIIDAEAKPATVSAGTPVNIAVSVAAAGPGVPEMGVTVRINTVVPPVEVRKTVAVPAGAAAGLGFEFKDLPPGLHQAEILLDRERKDNLPADDIRYLTFRVAEPRPFLTLADDPASAGPWQDAHDAVGEFECVVKKPAEVADFAGYEAVCLLAVAEPPWEKLQKYVEAGGKLLVLPGNEKSVSPTAYAKAAAGVLPATLGAVIDTDSVGKRAGVAWLVDDAAMRHPLLAPFREWRLRGNVDVVENPRLSWKFWDTELLPEGTVVVRYDEPNKRPAVLERRFPATGGAVLLVTTRLDAVVGVRDGWNNYYDSENSSWHVVFPHLLLKALCGGRDEMRYTFVAGQAVGVPLPAGERKAGFTVRVEGPGVSGRDATITPAAKQAEVRISPDRTLTAGNFRLLADGWSAGFSLNPPADEFTLAKVPAEAIEKLFGPESITAVEKDRRLRDALATKFDQPLDLFPWLLILVLLAVAGEGVLANRFYRVR